jgi:hypothetical protein
MGRELGEATMKRTFPTLRRFMRVPIWLKRGVLVLVLASSGC